MGCLFSAPEVQGGGAAAGAADAPRQPSSSRRAGGREAPTKNYAKPRWKSAGAGWTQEQLDAKRAEFWDTQPAYGGSKVIWDVLKAAAAAPDMDTTRLLLEAAGVIVARPDLSVCYDESGVRYELPNYLWSPPSNLQQQQQV